MLFAQTRVKIFTFRGLGINYVLQFLQKKVNQIFNI